MKNMSKLILILLSLFIFSNNINAEETINNSESNKEEIKVDEGNTNSENSIIDYNYTNSVTGYKVIIEDDAHLLKDSELNNLKDKMIELTDYGNIAFKTIDDNNTSTSNYAERFYHQLFGTESGSLFLIDMDNREIFIFSDGENYKVIDNSKAYSITDNVYRYASNKQYYLCAISSFNQMLDLLKGYKINEPMRYISNILISITCAAFLNYFFVIGKSRIKKASDKEILKNCKIDFQIGNINGTKSGTTRVYSPVSDSSSSGGHSHSHHSSGGHFGGGGGGHSGGGGGHRF